MPAEGLIWGHLCRLQAAVSIQEEGVSVTPELTGAAVHMALDAMAAGDSVRCFREGQLGSLLFTSEPKLLDAQFCAVLPAASLCYLHAQP